ncbi:hypothetical protein RhiirA1_478018 [Rhizophagus irregularis]|uniref:Uncharacterized protein n=1 Tax=Rhizophagus irregularis TaxID=588596 RepID=A0A2N0QSN2_9GLOM|nr:hypothetical protein RhiirA1_478018 [Rhizophagus irregularis]
MKYYKILIFFPLGGSWTLFLRSLLACKISFSVDGLGCTKEEIGTIFFRI